jgi:L-arabinonolactonase
MSQIETHRCIIGDGPMWDVTKQALYFIYILGKKVLRFDPATELAQQWDVPDVIGSMSLRVSGGAVVALAMCEGQKVVQFRPDGGFERVIDTPVKCPASVMFGGAALDQLYVTSLSPAFLGREEAPLGGCTFVIAGLGVKDLPEPHHAG